MNISDAPPHTDSCRPRSPLGAEARGGPQPAVQADDCAQHAKIFGIDGVVVVVKRRARQPRDVIPAMRAAGGKYRREALESVVEGTGAIICALAISFSASWRLALVLLCVFPFLIVQRFDFKILSSH